MLLPALVALGSAGILFVVSFGLLVLGEPPVPIATLLICAGTGVAAGATAYLYRPHWLVAGIGAGAVSGTYFLLVFVTLLRREQVDFWPLVDATIALAAGLLAARLGSKVAATRPA